jgi:hypothetical protein
VGEIGGDDLEKYHLLSGKSTKIVRRQAVITAGAG